MALCVEAAMNTPDTVSRRTFPIVVLCAVVQGWALYGLHLSITDHFWPATRPQWLMASYSVIVFIPVTIQLLASWTGSRTVWWLIALITAGVFYIGWFHGAHISGPGGTEFEHYDLVFPAAFELLLCWLIALPFLQSRLIKQSWSMDYRVLFASAWRNKLTLAEAALFVGLFWGLLGLWQMLFHLLAIDYFRQLFQEPAFVYPITALAFGISLHLIGSLEQWTRVVLEQILNVLKWLALLASLMLILFSVALIPKLPTLVFTGSRAIDATWLLWLVAVVVLFLNAAFRDGSVGHPYPQRIGQILRYSVPSLILVSVVAIFALGVRVHEYGLTVQRFWAMVVAAFSLIYALGYSWSAIGGSPWMERMARVNVAVALLLLLVLTASLTPLVTPYRLAASSQYRMALIWRGDRVNENGYGRRHSPFQYLRFDAGSYGLARLHQLADDSSVSSSIRGMAAKALTARTRWETSEVVDTDSILAGLVIYPTGSALTDDLKNELKSDVFDRPQGQSGIYFGRSPVAGLFLDLDGDAQNEFVLLWTAGARVYKLASGKWQPVGNMIGGGDSAKVLTDRLADNDVHVRTRKWKDLQVGRLRYQFTDDPND
jgi:hypothetical protein